MNLKYSLALMAVLLLGSFICILEINVSSVVNFLKYALKIRQGSLFSSTDAVTSCYVGNVITSCPATDRVACAVSFCK